MSGTTFTTRAAVAGPLPTASVHEYTTSNVPVSPVGTSVRDGCAALSASTSSSHTAPGSSYSVPRVTLSGLSPVIRTAGASESVMTRTVRTASVSPHENRSSCVPSSEVSTEPDGDISRDVCVLEATCSRHRALGSV